MELMNSIAAMSMDMSAAKLTQSYSTAVTKKAMDTQELAMQELLRMLPAEGSVIDTYA